MNAWERFRKWVASLIWPEYAKEVEQLTARLATVHGRMQDLYWDGKAKEIAYSRIAGLEDALWRACVALAISGQEEASKKFCEESGILWNADTIDRWRVKPPADAPSEGQEPGPLHNPPVPGATIEHLLLEGCVFHGTDPMGWCRTHNRQCLSGREYMARVKGTPS